MKKKNYTGEKKKKRSKIISMKTISRIIISSKYKARTYDWQIDSSMPLHTVLRALLYFDSLYLFSDILMYFLIEFSQQMQSPIEEKKKKIWNKKTKNKIINTKIKKKKLKMRKMRIN